MAAVASASDTVRDEKLCGSGMDTLSRDAHGCRSRNASVVSLQSGASLSSELRIRIAALILSSSIFDTTAMANAALLADDLAAYAGGLYVNGTMTSVTDRFFRTEAILCLRPDLRGAVSIVVLKLRKVIHASTDEGVVKIFEMAEIRLHGALWPNGECV
jgi:hypothetical protein